MYEPYIPDWSLGDGRIDEVLFAQEFLASHSLAYVDGSFFTPEGRIADIGSLRKQIYDEISFFIRSGAGRKVDRILETLALEARKESLDMEDLELHVENGTFHLQNGFSPERKICRHRLPVRFNEEWPMPRLWLEFLEELLEPEDIPTLQEYMGYCLIPVTHAQKMLILVGSGGEGKSRIGVVMKAILGSNLLNGSLAKVELNNFARADLEHHLVMVDDDLRMEALPQTNYIKTIITADCPLDLERKGIQSHQGMLYTRFLAFGNDTVHALYDHSQGFYRRQLVIYTKPRREGRIDDPDLGAKLVAEKEAIFHWALLGLLQLLMNRYQFTISDRSRKIMERNQETGNTVLGFLRSEGYLRLDPQAMVSTRRLYRCYEDWCDDNSVKPMSSRSFSQILELHPEFGLTPTNHVPIGSGKQARGFRGVRLINQF